jgi:colanic acid/amylovoran biosynthesis protein
LAGLPVLALAVLLGRFLGRLPLGLLPPRWRAVAQAFAAADLVVSCPGGFLFSAGLSLTLVISVFTMALAVLAGKPLYLLPQSIGPLRRRWERALVGWILARARLVMVREAVSLDQAPLPADRRRVHLLPDLALTFAGAPREEAEAWLRAAGLDLSRSRPWLGVTAINWRAQHPEFTGQADYEAALAAAARRFVADCGGVVLFFPQVCGPSQEQDDRVAARRVAALLAGLGHGVFVLEQQPPPAVLKSAIGLADLFIGTRMHSNLFALSQGVPCLSIAYQFKTQGIMRMLRLDPWVMDITAARGSAVADRLAALWQDRAAVRAHLAQVLPPLIAQAAQAGPLIAADYAAWHGRP